MRILLLAAQPMARGVLRVLPSLGVDVVVVRSLTEADADPLIQEARIGARGDRDNPVDLRWSRRALRTVVRDVRPDLLHVVGDPWTPTAEAGAAAARDFKVPYVLAGMSLLDGARSLTARWQADRIRRDAAALAAPVWPALLQLRGDQPDTRPSAVVPLGGVTIPGYSPPRPESAPITFATVGRLIPERGVDLLLDALAASHGAWRLLIVGTGPTHEALEHQAQGLGLAARLQWLGALPRDHLPAIWAETDAIVASSHETETWTEVTGGVVLEAMAHGVAPVVTRCGALPDIVDHAGLIVEQRDPHALTRALQCLVDDPAQCRAIGTSARERVLEHYTDAAAAAAMVRLWQMVLRQAAITTVSEPIDGPPRME